MKKKFKKPKIEQDLPPFMETAAVLFNWLPFSVMYFTISCSRVYNIYRTIHTLRT